MFASPGYWRAWRHGLACGIVGTLMATCAPPARAAAFGVIGGPGNRVDLYMDAGPCTHGALLAVYVPREGPEVAGCWRLMTHDGDGSPLAVAVVSVAYLDGTARAYPATWVRKAVSL